MVTMGFSVTCKVTLTPGSTLSARSPLTSTGSGPSTLVLPGEPERELSGDTRASGGRLVRSQKDGVLGAGRAAEPGEGSGTAPSRVAGTGAAAALGARLALGWRPESWKPRSPDVVSPPGPAPLGSSAPGSCPGDPCLPTSRSWGLGRGLRPPRSLLDLVVGDGGPRLGPRRTDVRALSEARWGRRWYPAVPPVGRGPTTPLPPPRPLQWRHLGLRSPGGSLANLEGRSEDFFALCAFVESGRSVNNRRNRDFG